MSAFRHVKTALSFGFQHLFYEDNIPNGGACYSFSYLCNPDPQKLLVLAPPGVTPLPGNESGIFHVDHFARDKMMITLDEHRARIRFLTDHLHTYYELPALYDGCADLGAQQSIFADFAE